MLKKYYNRYKQSADGKALVSNFMFLTLLQVASFVFPLITLPYLSRVIGADGFGKIAFASAIIVWVNTFVDWGFSYTSTREVARHREDKAYVSAVYSNTFWAKMLLMGVAGLVLLICVWCVPLLWENRGVLFFTYLMIPGQIMFADWFFQALERMKYITYFNLLIKVLFTAAVFVVVKEPSDYVFQPLLISMGFLIVGAASMYLVLKRWKFRLERPNMKAMWGMIVESKDIFINTLAPNLYNSFSVVLLGIVGSPHDNGVLDAGRKFPTLSNRVVGIFSRVFYPFLVRKEEKHGAYVKLMLAVTFLIVGSLWILGPWLLSVFYTKSFEGAGIVLRIQLVSLFFLSLSSIYGTNYLIIQKKDRLVRNITIVSSLIGFVVAVPLIYYYHYVGAALTYTVASVCLGSATAYYGIRLKREMKLKRKNKG